MEKPDTSQNTGTPASGSSDESIGRPREWREGRYQQPGKPVDQSVNDPSQRIKKEDPRDRPVTREDYEG
jgi:hypothetical protein